MQTKQRKSASPILIALVVVILIGAALLAAISLNQVRAGDGAFISNLWGSNATEASADLYLEGNSAALPIPPYVKTIMLLGSDYSPGGGHRTDVMLLAAFNLKNGKINLFSFPRDLWVEIPGYYPQRLNVAHPLGGYELLGDTLAYNFGFRPDHYAIADFEGFKLVVDWLGGVDVEVSQHMEDACFFTPEGWCVVEPGTVHMDGDYALWYVRARLNSSDFDRTRRAQEVIQAIARKALSPAYIFRLPAFIETALDVVETDMSVADMWLYAFPLSKFFRQDLFTTYTLTPNEAAFYVTDEGASVLLPNVPAIQAILQQVFWIE